MEQSKVKRSKDTAKFHNNNQTNKKYTLREETFANLDDLDEFC